MTYFHFLDNGSKFDLILGKLVYFTMAKNNILNKSRIENIRKIWVSTLQIPFYYCIIWLQMTFQMSWVHDFQKNSAGSTPTYSLK